MFSYRFYDEALSRTNRDDEDRKSRVEVAYTVGCYLEVPEEAVLRHEKLDEPGYVRIPFVDWLY